MHKIVVITAASVLVFCSPTCSQSQDRQGNQTKACIGKANKTTVSAYIMLIRLRGDLYGKWKATGVWPDDQEANKALTAHSQYWRDQLKAGRAILGGGMNGDYWDNVAIIIFEAGSLAEADSIVKNDPAVKAYVFQAQVRPFDVHFLTNKFTPGTQVCAQPN
jgi:uncharacterized protein YciI